MHKLKLDLEMLCVESFDTVRHVPEAAGTVRGREESVEYTGCACPAPPPTEVASCKTCYGQDTCFSGWTYCPICM